MYYCTIKKKAMLQRISVTSLIIGLLIVFSVVSLISLSISPLPWFDEIVFANISESFNAGNFLELSAAPPIFDDTRQVYVYGPVFFALSSIPIALFGLSEITFRFLPLFFGLLCIALVQHFFFKKRKIMQLTLALLIISDAIFTSNSHSGRMDTMAIFFWITGLLFSMNSFEKDRFNYAPWITGLCFALGYLTTPRSFMVYGNFALLYFIGITIQFGYQKALINSIKAAIAFITPVGLWIFFIFGSLTEYQAYYSNLSGTFVGGTPLPPIFQWPLIMIVGLLFLYGVLFKKDKLLGSFKSPIVPFSIASMISFYVLVFDTGTYSIFIIFFYYLLLITWSDLLLLKKYRNILLLLFVIGNSLILSIKYAVVFTGERWAKKEQMNAFIKQHVGPGNLLIGDDVYYYGCRKNAVEFQFMDYYLSDSTRESLQRELYHYDYLFVSDRMQNEKPKIIEVYKKNSVLVPIDTLHFDKSIHLPAPLASLQNSVYNSYNGVLYKRNKSSKLDR